jgi:hypothetical protein
LLRRRSDLLHIFTHGNEGAAIDVAGIAFGSVDAAFCAVSALGNGDSTIEIEVRIGVDGVVARGTGVEITAADGEVAGGVEGVVIRMMRARRSRFPHFFNF